MHRRLLTLLLGLYPALAATAGEVRIRDAWIQEPPPGVELLAGYLEITNPGPETRILESVRSPAFGRIEIHRTQMDGDVARMEHKQNLTLSPGQQIEFRPGDYHLMLYEPVRPLRVGDRVELTFGFRDQPPVTVEAEVRRSQPGAAPHHHHPHH